MESAQSVEGMRMREIMLFLHSHGVSTGRAVWIYKTYGEQAIEKVRRTHTPSQKTSRHRLCHGGSDCPERRDCQGLAKSG
jgi:hypothetical protein